MIVSGQYPTMVEKELCTYPLVDVLETKVMSPFPVSKTRRPPTCILRQYGVLFTAYHYQIPMYENSMIYP